MPRTTHTSTLRTHMGSSRAATPGAVPGFIHVKADCGLTAKQIIGVLPKNARIASVSVVGNTSDGGTQPTTGTFQMDLEATAAPLPVLSLVNVVAAAATLSAVGTKTVVAASLLLPFRVERNISVTLAAGTAGQTAWFVIECIPADDGKMQN